MYCEHEGFFLMHTLEEDYSICLCVEIVCAKNS